MFREVALNVYPVHPQTLTSSLHGFYRSLLNKVIFWEFQPFTQINNSSLGDDKFQSRGVGRRLNTSMENSTIGTLNLQIPVCLNPTIPNFLDVK